MTTSANLAVEGRRPGSGVAVMFGAVHGFAVLATSGTARPSLWSR
jgi:hypothetical protein